MSEETEETKETEKEFVLRHWDAEFRRGDKHRVGVTGGRIYAKLPGFGGCEWILSGNVNIPFEASNCLAEELAWERAAEFTREILRRAHKIEAEIEWLEKTPHITGDMAFNRIMSREVAALAVLKEGMKK